MSNLLLNLTSKILQKVVKILKSVYRAGLFIDQEAGASPHGIITCTCCGKGVLDVKCPFCVKDCLPQCLLPHRILNRLHKYSDFRTRAIDYTLHVPSALLFHCHPTWRIATVAMDTRVLITSAENIYYISYNYKFLLYHTVR